MANIIGLDISENSVKAVAGRFQNGRFSISSFNELPLVPGIVRNWEVRDPEALGETLKELFNNAKPRPFRARQAILAVPEQKVFLHVMPAPAVAEEKLAEVVKWELAANISEDIENTYWDWEVFTDDKGNTTQVLAASISKKVASEFEKVLGRLGIKIIAFDMEVKSLARAMGKQLKQPGSSLIVDISAKSTTFSVYNSGFVSFTSGLMIGSDKCTEEIAAQEGIDEEKAEVLKKELDFTKMTAGNGNRATICPMLENVAGEIRQTLDFYKDKKISSEPVTRVVLAGGGSTLKGLDKYFSGKINLPVAKADFLINLDKSSRALLGSRSMVFGTALGLAMRGSGSKPITGELNLIAQELQEDAAASEVKNIVNLLTGLVVGLTVIMIAAFVGLYLFLQANTKNLQVDIAAAEMVTESSNATVTAELSKANLYIRTIADLESKQTRFSRTVAAVAAAADDQIEVRRLVLSPQEDGRILGTAASRADLVAFQDKLAAQAGISNVANPLSNFSTTEKSVVEFEITFSFDK
jgi:type IV pilus assembly protein PilM